MCNQLIITVICYIKKHLLWWLTSLINNNISTTYFSAVLWLCWSSVLPLQIQTAVGRLVLWTGGHRTLSNVLKNKNWLTTAWIKTYLKIQPFEKGFMMYIICDGQPYFDSVPSLLLSLRVCLSPAIFIWVFIWRLVSVVTVFVIYSRLY